MLSQLLLVVCCLKISSSLLLGQGLGGGLGSLGGHSGLGGLAGHGGLGGLGGHGGLGSLGGLGGHGSLGGLGSHGGLGGLGGQGGLGGLGGHSSLGGHGSLSGLGSLIGLGGLGSLGGLSHGHHHHRPEPYTFGYHVKDKKSDHYRKEEGDGKGVVKGSYGYKDAKGLYRNVDYIADKFGFRAIVKTNEPGTANQNSAHVNYHHQQPPHHVYHDKGILGGLGHGLGGHGFGGGAGLGHLAGILG